MIHHSDTYIDYTAEDFLHDSRFVATSLNPTEESEAFWVQLINSGKVDAREYFLAKKMMSVLQVRTEVFSAGDKASLLDRILQSNTLQRQRKAHRIRLRIAVLTGIAAAGLAVLLVGDGALWNHQPGIPGFQTGIEQVVLPGTPATDIRLVVNQGEIINLKGRESTIVHRDEEIVIESEAKTIKRQEEDAATEVAYNQLIVPLGKRATLTLADSTCLAVNAGTRVVYPSVFASDHREIFVDGEVFIEVAYDSLRPFSVKTGRMTLEALGTAFDVNTYHSDDLHYVVLVEGSLRISAGDGGKIIKPGEMLALVGGEVSIRTVNTGNYTSWKDGICQYESEALGVIMQRLVRYYGQEIECDAQAAALRCSGKLFLNEDLPTVLEGIATFTPIQVVAESGKFVITGRE
jgi:hypothetical protein